jgi:drug/metabolite transporter (DMT)-like permease
MSARAWIAFGAVSTLWGIPYLFIKIADEGGMPPVTLAWARVVLGAVVLLALAWRSGTLASLRGRWRWIAVYAAAEIAIPFPMIAAGEQRIASSTAAIVIATAPLLVALLAIRFEPAERVDRRRLTGLLLGLLGVAALVGLDLTGGSGQLLGIAAVLVAALGYAIGPMVLKRQLSDLDPVAAMGGSLALAAVALTPVAATSLPAARPSDGALGAVVVLGLLCTAAALVLMARLVNEVGPGRALVITYINPVVAVGLGVAFLGETPGAGAVAGLLLILAGSWLSTDGRIPPGMAMAASRLLRSRRSPGRGSHAEHSGRQIRLGLRRRWKPPPPARSAS